MTITQEEINKHLNVLNKCSPELLKIVGKHLTLWNYSKLETMGKLADLLAQAHQSGIEQGRSEERKQLTDDIMAEIDGHYDNPNLAGNLEDLLGITYQEWELENTDFEVLSTSNK